MSERARWLLVSLALVALGTLWLLWRSANHYNATSARSDVHAEALPRGASTDAALTDVAIDRGHALIAGNEGGGAPGSRRSFETAESAQPIVGRVLHPDRTPLRSVRVQWTPMRSSFENDWPLAVPWEEIRSASRQTITDQAGWFTLDLPRAGTADEWAVIWAASPGVEPSAHFLRRTDGEWIGCADPAQETNDGARRPADALAPTGNIELICSSLAGQVVHVQSNGGLPATGATVRMLGQARLTDTPGFGARLARARRLFFYDAVVDENGNASLPAFRIPVVYQAIRGSELSDVRRGVPNQVLELMLAEGLQFDARVVLASGAEVGERDVIAVGRQAIDDTWSWIGGFKVRPDGTCGPHTLPNLPSREWQFMLQAERLLTAESRLSPWTQDRIAHVTLDGNRAQRVTVRTVADSTGEPVEHATVRARWLKPGTTTEVHFGRSTLSDEHGLASVGVPIGEGFSVTVERSGFGDGDAGPLVANADVVEVRLVAESTLRGRVHHGGAPVTAFKVTCWTTNRLKYTYQEFVSADGTFVMERMPQDVVTIYAVGSGFGQCQPVKIDLRGKDQGEVVLELPTSVRGRGRVIDADTRQPIDGALVQIYTTEQFQMLSLSGVETRTSPDGRFELDGFAPSYSSIYCLKEGYAPQYAFAIGKAGEEIDFGFVSMTPDDPYCMQLIPSPWQGLTVGSWRTNGAASSAGIVPDASGQSCVRGVKPGLLSLELSYSDRSTVEFDFPIMPGKPVEWTHTIGGPAGATVELRGLHVPPCDARPPYRVKLCYVTPEGVDARRYFDIGDDGTGKLEGLVPGPQILTVSDDRGIVARRRITIDSKREQVLSIDVGCASRCLQLLTQTGEPYAQKIVLWCQQGEHHTAKEGKRTDANGQFCIPAEVVGTIELTALESGFVVAQPVLLNASPEPRQIVQLAPLGELAIRLVDEGQPQLGIVCMLHNESPFFSWAATSTNEQGVARWEQMSLSPQRLHISGQGLWKQSSLLQPRPEPAPIVDVPVYRLGDLAVRAIDATGLNAAGTRFELVHHALGGSASTWLAEGRISSDTGSMLSGQDGKLLLSGLPRGEYTVRAELSGGKQAQAQCDVAPGQLSHCVISVP